MGYTRSLDLPDRTLQFIRDRPLMDQAVQPISELPLLVRSGPAFTRIVVASAAGLDGSSHRVMFIGTGTNTAGSVPPNTSSTETHHYTLPAFPLQP